MVSFLLNPRTQSSLDSKTAETTLSLLQRCSNVDELKQIHGRMLKTGFVRDSVLASKLLSCCISTNSSNLVYAQMVFDRISRSNTFMWNIMIRGYSQSKEPEQALLLYTQMISHSVEHNSYTFPFLLKACSYLSALQETEQIHAHIVKLGFGSDVYAVNSLLHAYAVSGSIPSADLLFNQVSEGNIVSWTAIISGFAIHGHGREALNCFAQMQKDGIKPNAITFTAILTACSYAGLVAEGYRLFESMKRNYDLNPSIEHYGCMVDLLGRAGLLKEAVQLVETMTVKPNAIIWGTLLKACWIHRNVELGKRIGEILIEIDPNHGGRYVQLASIHALAGEWDRVIEARTWMKLRGVSKLPGCSSISLNGTVHEFLAGDRSHPNMKEIHDMWAKIVERLRYSGYKPVIKPLPLDLEDEEKETAIHQHSEKLAISFALIKTRPGTTIWITKNLRVCEDCHIVAKFISKIYARDIVMRDRTRFHHFRDGKCSCGDYW